MKKQFKLEELDCANCAAFMEEAINKLPEVKHATVSFMMARLVIEADDDAFPEVIEKAQKCISGVNRKTKIVR